MQRRALRLRHVAREHGLDARLATADQRQDGRELREASEAIEEVAERIGDAIFVGVLLLLFATVWVRASLPHGIVTVKAVKGGLDVLDPENNDPAVIASAPAPCVSIRQGPLASNPAR